MGLPRIRASAGCLVGVAALLHALHLSVPGLDSDQAIVGLMGRHILSGEFPTFFWGESYSGTAESFLAALFFWGFGASRYTLALAPALVSLAFLWAAWRLAREIFGDGTALLALALLAIPPVFLVLHGVLARGNYIENLFLGTLCLVLAVRLGATEPGSPRARRLALLLGGFAGVAWYMSFQSLPYLIAAAGYLLWRRGRRLVPLLPAMLAAFVVGSLPFWLHNLSGDFASAGAVRQSWGRVTVPEGAHRLAGQLPVLLGARDFTYTYERLRVAAVPGLSPLAGAVCGAGVLLALIDGLVRRRHAGTGLLALFVAAVLVMVVFGGFSAAAGDPRYLLPLYSALPLLLARGIAIAWRWRAVAIGGVLVVLAANLAAHGSVLAAEVSRYPRYRGEDRQLLEYLRAQGHTRVYAPDYWLGYRLTFDAGEDVILATPFWRDQPRWASKFPPYTFQVKAEPRAAYVVSGRVDSLRATLDAAGVGYLATRIGRFTVLHGFRRPPGGRPVPSAGWRASEPAGALAFDRDPWTVWRGAALGIDLGRVVWVEQTVLLLAPAGPHPRGVVLEGSADGRRWDRLAEVADVVPGFAWIGEHLALEEPRRVALTFAPAAVRHLRLLGQPAEVAELFVYERGLAEPSPRLREAVGAELAGRWPDALARFAEIALDDPDDEDALRRAMIAGRELGLDGWRAIYEFLSRQRLTGRSESRLRFARRYWELAGHRQLAWQRLGGVLAERGDREGADAVRAAMVRHFAPSVPVAVDFGTLGRDARFLGYDMRPPSAAPGASVEITYYWQMSRGARPDRWWVFVHFHDGRAVRLTQDHSFPQHGREPGWEAGERVRESYRLAIPARLDPGVYRIRLGLWSPDSGRRWRVWRNGWPTATHVADVGALTLGPEPPEPPADTR